VFLSRKAKYWVLALIIGIQTVRSSAFAQAQGAAAPQGGLGQSFSFFMPLLLVFAIFYFLIIRPQQKQAKKQQEMLKAIEKGDQVITVGGIHGKVVGTTDTVLTLEIADNVKVKVERASVQSTKTAGKAE
jgi:preprotein translocase subunit YajC